MRTLTDKTLAICILARNCGDTLPIFLAKIEKLRRPWQDSRVFIVENNSTDRTREIILRYRQTASGVVADCFDDFRADQLDRIERMALLRNRYLALVAKQTDFIPDYLMVVDADIDFDEDRIIPVMQDAPSNWVSLLANGKYYVRIFGKKLHVLYYDLYALVPAESPEYRFNKSQMFANRAKIQRALRKNKYAACRAAFGGLGIYRYSALEGKSYTLAENTKTNKFRYVCEHIPLTMQLQESGKNYICRDLSVSYERLSYARYFYALLRQFFALRKPK